MRKLSYPAGLLFLLCAALSLGSQDSAPPPSPGASDPFLKERQTLSGEVSTAVPDLPPLVGEALSLIPRHLFAPESHLSFAYQNRSLPLGEGKFLPAPGDIAKIAALLNPGPDDRILFLGSSAGYGAALFSFLGKEVVLMEEIETEREKMRRLMENNPVLRSRANLFLVPDWAPHALAGQEPFDIIFLHGGVTEIPSSILALTKPEARIAALLKGE